MLPLHYNIDRETTPMQTSWLQTDMPGLTSLLDTRFIMIRSGRSMVLATARTTSLACCLVGQSNRLYRTVCFLVQRRSS